MVPVKAKVHSALAKDTDFWSYDGSVPGPTIVVQTGQRVRVKYLNHLFTPGSNPPAPAIILYSAYTVTTPVSGLQPMLTTGSEKNKPDTVKNTGLDTLTGWTVAHLHGAPSVADSDGWTDNVAGPGEIAEGVYDFPEQTYWIIRADKTRSEFKGGIAPTLWYHDHCMSVTRFNVYSGLSGMWLVRLPKEAKLGLPTGDHEIPLVVQDRNFETTGSPHPSAIEGKTLLGKEFHRLGHDELNDHGQNPHGHGHTLVVLREEESGLLFLHEMMEKAMATSMGLKLMMNGISLTLPGAPLADGTPTNITCVSVARRFNDAATISLMLNSWNVWKVINLSPDTHPFHIHLVQFQALKRISLLPVGAPTFPKVGDKFTFGIDPSSQDPEPNETGWKDVVRVNPGERQGDDDIVNAEMLTLAAQFTGHAGRYMYHGHILEHEDQQMMRPFLVVPEALGPFMESMAMPMGAMSMAGRLSKRRSSRRRRSK